MNNLFRGIVLPGDKICIWEWEWKYSLLPQWIFLILALQRPSLEKLVKQDTQTTTPRMSFSQCQQERRWERNIFEPLHYSQAHSRISSNRRTMKGRCRRNWFYRCVSCPSERLKSLLGILHLENDEDPGMRTREHLCVLFPPAVQICLGICTDCYFQKWAYEASQQARKL